MTEAPSYKQFRDDPREFLFGYLAEGSVGAEVGVHLGDFSALLLAQVAPRTLHLVDPWAYQESPAYRAAWFGGLAAGQPEMDRRWESVRRRFAQEIVSGQIVIHRRDARDALGPLPDHALDWIYIDGNHLYPFVREDLALSLRKVRPGGLILGDDYGIAGWWADGVTRAVDAFVAAHPVTVIEIKLGQYVLRTPAGDAQPAR